MLAFDIETEGLDSVVDDITVASVYDPDRDIKKTFFFKREGFDRQENIDQFLQVLDDAPLLCCFNGVRFDIPFIIARFDVAQARYTNWFMKVGVCCMRLYSMVKFRTLTFSISGI